MQKLEVSFLMYNTLMSLGDLKHMILPVIVFIWRDFSVTQFNLSSILVNIDKKKKRNGNKIICCILPGKSYTMFPFTE